MTSCSRQQSRMTPSTSSSSLPTHSHRLTLLHLLHLLLLVFLATLSTHLPGAEGTGRVLHESSKTDEYKSFIHKYLYDTDNPTVQADRLKETGSIMAEEMVRGFLDRFPTQGHLAEFVRDVAADQNSGIRLKCRVQILEMYEAFINLQKWAVQMIDSWGKPGPGLMYLNPVFRGHYQECIDVRAHFPFPPEPTPVYEGETTDRTHLSVISDEDSPLHNKSREGLNNSGTLAGIQNRHALSRSTKDVEMMEILQKYRLETAMTNDNHQPMTTMRNVNTTEFDDVTTRKGNNPGYSGVGELPFLERVWTLLKSNEEAKKEPERVLFKGKYCKVGVGMPNMPVGYTELPILKIYIGTSLDLCLPDSCDKHDADAIVNRTLRVATFDPNQTTFIPLNSVCQEEIPIQSKTIGIACFMVIGVLWLIYTTAYDVIMVQRPRWKLEELKEEFIAKRAALLESAETPIPGPALNGHNNHHHASNGHATEGVDNGHVINGDDLTWLVSRARVTAGALDGGRSPEDGDDSSKKPLEDILFEPPPLTNKEKYLSFFSVYTNGKKIINTNLAEGTLTSLHGLRFLSMCWIILGHSMLIGMVNVENVVDFMWEMKSNTLFLIITNGFLCVDSFFVMSGMMVGYYFQGIVDHDCRWKWIVYVIHRFVRLSPALSVFCAAYVGMWPYLGSGPNYPAKAPDEDMCKETWMYTLFFINNFLPLEKLCMMWTWYLSCDYQFYLVCPLFMVPLAKGYKKTGIALGLLLMFGTILASGLITYHYGMAEMLPQLMTSHGMSRPQDYYNMFYQRPYCRMGPYIVGLYLGYILWHTDRKVNMPKWLVAVGWITSTVVALSTLFGVHESFAGYRYMSDVEVAVYNGLKHTVFGLCVAWVLFACLTGYGGYVQTILSFKPFIPLSRLTYCTYLVHPVVVYLFSYSQNGVFWLNSWNLAFHYLGVLFLSIVMGGLLSVFVESPTIRIEREILIQLDLVPPSTNF